MILNKLFNASSFAVEYKFKYKNIPHNEKAAWLQKKIEKLGPTYIKLGQFVSNRSDILGENTYLKIALEKLHDEVEPLPWKTISDIIEKNDAIEKFIDIQKVPLAAASIGQVHRATLTDTDGVVKDVVIKIMRPDIATQVDNDIRIIKFVLGILALFANESKQIQFKDAYMMLDDVRTSILKESNMNNELNNVLAFRQIKLDKTIIPNVYPAISSQSIIVMDYVPSIKFRDAYAFADKSKRKTLAFNIMDCFIRQFLFHGVIHGDPHPGNIALCPDLNSFVMYDFGNIVQLDLYTRNYFKLLVFELMNENIPNVMSILEKIPKLVTIKNKTVLKKYIVTYIEYIKTIDINVLKKLASRDVNDQDLPIKFSSTIFEIIRIFGTIEGICLDLDPTFSYEEVFYKYADTLFADTEFILLKAFHDVNGLIDHI